MKRKASALDDHTAYDYPSVNYSPSASTASPDSVKTSTDHDRTQAYWNVGTIPYMNLRTRKRYRDARPDSETVHQKTLTRLFDAQKQIHLKEQKSGWQSSSPFTQQTPNSSLDQDMWQAPIAELSQPEPNQRSLHSFFGGGSRSTARPKIQHSAYQFSAMRNASPELSRCEDCNSTLHPTIGNNLAIGMDGMDVDSQQDEWACASCSRRVCDTCAVRGDFRICLECAVPGGG